MICSMKKLKRKKEFNSFNVNNWQMQKKIKREREREEEREREKERERRALKNGQS